MQRGQHNDDAASASVPSRAGRKRDHSRDGVILEMTLAVLAEHGFDQMTVDMVAARAGSARATVYRRWPTKAELVLEAVSRMSHDDAQAEPLPDTGNLRDDMIATIRPLAKAEQQTRIQAVIALMTLARTDPRFADAAVAAGIAPWVEVNRELIQRAVDRREFPPPADLDTLAALVPMMCLSRAMQQLPITREFSLSLIDGVVLPALRGGHSTD